MVILTICLFAGSWFAVSADEDHVEYESYEEVVPAAPIMDITPYFGGRLDW